MRWKEEKTLLKHEMKWTIAYFRYKETEWLQRLRGIRADEEGARGLAAYAVKQAEVWAEFAKEGSMRLATLGDINI